MDETTIRELLEVNRRFYESAAAAFSATRGRPWRGWEHLLPRLVPLPRSVLDAGCGNGRFGVWLRERLGSPFVYTGVDRSRALLAVAARAVPGGRFIAADLLADLIGRSPTQTPAESSEVLGEHDLVVAMGVLHHVPGMELRRALVRRLAGAVAEGGLLFLSFWLFDKRGVDPREAGIDPARLDPGDHLLRFAEEEDLRYCHRATESEIDTLIQSTGLTEHARWKADELNHYVLLERHS